MLLGKRQRLGGCHLKRERVQRGCGAIVAGSLAARRNPSSARVGACAIASGSHSGLHKARAAPTCGSPSALFPTMMRGRPGLAASTCGHWDECELRGSAQFGERGGLGERLLQPQREALKRASPGEVKHQQHTGRHGGIARCTLEIAGRPRDLPHEDLVPGPSRLVRV